jgi:hypothetical protein
MTNFIILIDYIVIITFLFVFLSFIDWLFENIRYYGLKLLNKIGFILIEFIKILFKCILYYLIAVLYVLFFTLLVNIGINLYYINNIYPEILDLFME